MATKFKITERWLGASGGWVEMKAARAIFKRGEVLEATFDGKLLQGSVRMGKRPLRCGLLIRSTTDIDNLCGCAESRRSGILCRHSLAVGLGFIHQAPAESPSAPSRKAARQKEAKEAPSFALPAGPVTVRFPGNTAAMLRRGQSAIQFEVGDEPDEAATTLDLPLLACLEGLGARAVPPMATLNAEQTTTMLQALLGHPRVQAGKESLKIENSPIRLSLQLSAFGDDHVGLKLLLNDPDAVILKGSKAAWVFLEKRRLFLPLRLPELAEDELSDLLATLDSGRSLSRTWSWFFRRVESLENSFVVDSRELEQEPALRTARPTFHLKLEGSLNHLTGRLTASYAGREVEACSEVGEGTFPYVDDNEPMVFWKRNRLAEEEAVARLDGAEFSGPDKKGYRTLRTENAILRFFASLLPDLQQRWKVEIGERFQHVTRKIERVEPQVEFQASAEPGWLEFDVGYGAGEASGLSRQEVQRLLQVGQSHVKRPDGRILAVDLQACEELNEVLRDVQPDQSGGRFRARQAQAAYLGHAIKNKGGDEAVRTEAVAFPEEALVDLKDILRSYQKEGVCWMLGRTRSGLSGILADEMGLGKTLQTLAMLQALEAESEEAAPVLIVCPTSLLGNWCQEAARFTPDLKTVRHHGPRRARKAEALLKHQLIVTSYGLLVRDLDLFKELSLRAVVLDEASAIKNPKTKTALAVCELEAPFRVALTGTPIENSARDIWSIMRFVSPGYLGEHADFQERYEGPLSAEGGAPVEVRRRFRKRLEPFILRRTKREVASELPEKIEKTLFCPLSDQQKKVYTDVLRQGREKADDLRRGNPGAAHMTMLTTLLRLRQVCCDLRLLNLPEKALEGTPGDLSSKMVALTELLDSMRDSGHRALIFSQFVGVLKLIQEAVAGLGLEHCYLDGQTRNRAEEVKRFQTSDIPVFLISLKAGGYGLNLTAADTVIHFDPWWNPAVEAQATDRAHRIGQENVVTAYKFIAQDTVEEKILRLQRKKRDVIDAALDDEQPLMQGLTTADLEEVLK